jgi:hypothetical protein
MIHYYKRGDVSTRLRVLIIFSIGSSFFVALSFGSGYVFAFCPDPDPPRVCSEFFEASAVFVGTVISVTEKHGNDDLIDGWTYLLKVDTNYRDVDRSPVAVFTANDSGSFLMKKGHTYLLFPIRTNGVLTIYGCGNSAEVPEAATSVRQIDTVVKNMKIHSGGEIGGEVQPPRGTSSGVEGIAIYITGNGRTYTGITDKEGSFQVRVPAGVYAVHAASPKWIITPDSFSYLSPDYVQINDGGCADLVFEAQPSETSR